MKTKPRLLEYICLGSFTCLVLFVVIYQIRYRNPGADEIHYSQLVSQIRGEADANLKAAKARNVDESIETYRAQMNEADGFERLHDSFVDRRLAGGRGICVGILLFGSLSISSLVLLFATNLAPKPPTPSPC